MLINILDGFVEVRRMRTQLFSLTKKTFFDLLQLNLLLILINGIHPRASSGLKFNVDLPCSTLQGIIKLKGYLL